MNFNRGDFFAILCILFIGWTFLVTLGNGYTIQEIESRVQIIQREITAIRLAMKEQK